jgi:flagellar M-ring protein FliF
MNQATKDQLVYGKKGVPLETSRENEQLRGGGPGGGGGGAAGTASNTVPSYAAGGSGGSSNYRRTNGQTKFGVNKQVTRTKVAPGTVKRESVAVLVDKSVPPAQIRAIRQAVQNAAGIDTARGDRLSVSQVAFAKPPAPAKAPVTKTALGFAKYVLAGLGLLAFLFFVTRHLRRREAETLMGEPVWLREIEAPTTLAELEAAGGGYRLDPGDDEEPRSRVRRDPVRGELEELIDSDPERVAQQVRAWMTEE